MKKITLGNPEEFVPSKFCQTLNYKETEIKFPLESIHFKEYAGGCIVEFPVRPDESFFGFGLQLKGMNYKSRKVALRVNSDPVSNTGDSHAPVPFFVSSAGYGMYFDTARDIEFYCGFLPRHDRSGEISGSRDIAVSTDDLYAIRERDGIAVMSVRIPCAKGIDIYVFEGEKIVDIVSEYNMLAGGGPNVPEWGLGVLYRAYGRYSEKEIIELAKYFRDNDIPCDIMGLEPGWQSGSYPCTFVWDSGRYPNYKGLIEYLKNNGFHINLWEHAYTHAASPIYTKLYEHSADYEVWSGIIPDFAVPEARKIFADYHREYLVKEGIDGFKLDECDNSDYANCYSYSHTANFPSGMDGEQYHHMMGTLYMQTIQDALGDISTLSEVRNAGALCAPYPFVLYSDLYDHDDFIRGVVTSGFSGILWTPEVRAAKSKKDLIRRLQSNIFSVQCIINAWYFEGVPWSEFGCEDEVRELLKLRKALVPMLKRAFDEYRDTGKPPVRALVCDYTDDSETYEIDNEYIFCDNLIVAPLTERSDTRNVYLPQGKWRNYFTKEPVNSGWFTVETDGIPVYEKC